MRFGLPVCPHCGKMVSLPRTWLLKTEGEYRCPRCGGYSNVRLDPLAPAFGVLAVMASVLIFLAVRFFSGGVTLTSVIYLLIPYVLFFFFSMFLVNLKKPAVKKSPAPQPPRRRPPPPGYRPGGSGDLDQTRH